MPRSTSVPQLERITSHRESTRVLDLSLVGLPGLVDRGYGQGLSPLAREIPLPPYVGQVLRSRHSPTARLLEA